MANMWTGTEEEKKRRAQDVALLMLNPYFLMRMLVLFFWETGRELWEAWLQHVKDVQPRLNRLEHGYPFVRAAMCGLMRDMSANIAILDMMRGAPSIYMLYLGYDEVAHHSGPWTTDAFGDLRRLDKTLARLHRVAEEKARRPYSFIILSDHGQSFGPTFKMRYGLSIKEFIEQQLPQGTTVTQAIGGDTGAMGLQGMAGELANMQQTGHGGALGGALAKQGEKLAQKGSEVDDRTADDPQHSRKHGRKKEDQHKAEALAEVTAYGSGNAAQVYFHRIPRKLKLSELDTMYPGMVDALIAHEGLGMVIGYADDMTAIVRGKGGSRNLHTGEVIGADPVAPYAPAEGHGAASLDTRIWQLKRVMDFPSAGDLWLHSTVYPDGTVAALEELVGNHGGVGGEQTDAFIFHPPDLVVPDTRCSTDVFHILNEYRSLPLAAQPAWEDTPAERGWSPAVLMRGLARARVWLPLALRCLFLERRAYAHVARDPYMTGPALLILVGSILITGIITDGAFDLLVVVAYLGIWLVTTLVIFAAGHLLTRGNTFRGTFSGTFRALAFAEITSLPLLLALYQPFEGAVRLFVLGLSLLAVWISGATAHKLRGWRAALFPLMALLVYVVGTIIIIILIGGARFTLDALLADFGLMPR
jgi:hypothetical protein